MIHGWIIESRGSIFKALYALLVYEIDFGNWFGPDGTFITEFTPFVVWSETAL
jgi:hypothetical protein